jgi:hypothetical protein
MHSLVQWRVGVGMNQRQHWRLYLAFMTAACVNVGEVAETVRFWRHAVVHLPPNERLLNETSDIEEERLWWMWSMVGQVLWEEVRWREGEELDVTCRKQGYRKEAEELGVKVLEAAESARRGASGHDPCDRQPGTHEERSRTKRPSLRRHHYESWATIILNAEAVTNKRRCGQA